MEWKTVRNWLLLLVLAADLILAGNMGWQLLRLRREERTAVLDAVAAWSSIPAGADRSASAGAARWK